MHDICLVILNWRNGADTTECLQSIIDSDSKIIKRVVVCDNNSNDNSVVDIRNWAQEKNVPLPEYAWNGSDFSEGIGLARIGNQSQSLQFVMIHTGKNLGFAGGNNVGIEFLCRNYSFDAILLLNNDALLVAGTVEQMARRFDDPKVGLCGCTVIYHHTPTIVQAFGGARFNPVFGRASLIGSGFSVNAPRDSIQIESELGYIFGAALMISHTCLDEVGLMEEKYFLYYEEIDWSIRARRKGFHLAYASCAVVYHKGGGTIGSNLDKSRRSFLSEYYLIRSRILFTMKFYPYFIPTVLIFTAAQISLYLLRLDFQRFWVGVRAIFSLGFSNQSRQAP